MCISVNFCVYSDQFSMNLLVYLFFGGYVVQFPMEIMSRSVFDGYVPNFGRISVCFS